MKRTIDCLLAAGMLCLMALPLACVALAVKLTSAGPVLYWSQRVGRYNQLFSMPKFRTMRTDTPQVATHLLDDPDRWLTPIGNLLRRTSLDELPQLWSILRGDMSFVGPRPALFNQYDLVRMRTSRNVHLLVPGLTGWAQINGRDESPIPQKVEFDAEYAQRQSLWFDLKIIVRTAGKVLRREGTRVPKQVAEMDSHLDRAA